MNSTHGPTDAGALGASPHADRLVQEFVEHWGSMARAWGVNTSMGELFALLYITGTDWTAEDLRQRLGVSRGNVSMNLRELLAWGLVHKAHRPGERRERFRAETDVWTLFRKILAERKRRELDPSLSVLDRAHKLASEHAELRDVRARIQPLRDFFKTIDALAGHLLSTAPPGDMAEIRHLLGPGPDREPATGPTDGGPGPGASGTPRADGTSGESVP